uniref:Uncharacterized protein n=1 Tax=Cannabis sativa TaxID=3483 RepID=A0A803P578_CANSA
MSQSSFEVYRPEELEIECPTELVVPYKPRTPGPKSKLEPKPPSASSIPLAKPLFLPKVAIAFEPGDLDFAIITSKPRNSRTPQDPNVTFEEKLIELKVRAIACSVGDTLRTCSIEFKRDCLVRSVRA